MPDAIGSTVRRSATGALVAAIATAGLLVAGTAPATAAPVSVSFASTGAPTGWIVPAGVTSITIDAYGGAGGEGISGVRTEAGDVTAPSGPAGLGGRVTSTVAVVPGEVVTVDVGGRGGDSTIDLANPDDLVDDGARGYGGGGDGDGGFHANATGRGVDGGPLLRMAVVSGAGGGRTVVTLGAGTIVAGGGGAGSPAAAAVDLSGTTPNVVFLPGVPGGGGGGTTGADGGDSTVATGGQGGGTAGSGAGGTPFGVAAIGAEGGDGVSNSVNGATLALGIVGAPGGGGAFGGGSGGKPHPDDSPSTFAEAVAFGGGGGGGGGSSAGPAGSTFETGVRAGDGLVTISYDAPNDQPDAMVRKGTSLPFVGNDVYSPSEQKVTTQVPGRSQTFQVRVQNDGTTPDRFRIRGSAGAAGIVVKYKVGSTNVTSAVLAGSYQTPVLAPGASTTLTINVPVANSVPAGTRHAFHVRATSRNTPTSFDVATAIVKVT